MKDSSGVGLIASMPVALLAHPSFPAKTIAEFITLAKAQPGKFTVGTSAIGTGGYMCAELFKMMAGVDVQIVPYKGTAPVMNDLLGGHVPVAFGVLPPAMGNLESGNLRAIAVTSLTRFSGLPNVPTVAESGLPGFEAVLHYGVAAPKGTPQVIIDKLNKEVRVLASNDDVRKRIASEGGDPLTSSAAEYDADIASEATKWAKLIKQLNLKSTRAGQGMKIWGTAARGAGVCACLSRFQRRRSHRYVTRFIAAHWYAANYRSLKRRHARRSTST